MQRSNISFGEPFRNVESSDLRDWNVIFVTTDEGDLIALANFAARGSSPANPLFVSDISGGIGGVLRTFIGDQPSDRSLKLKCKPGMDPKITEQNGRRVYHWASSHLEREDDSKDKDKKKKKKGGSAAGKLKAFADNRIVADVEIGKDKLLQRTLP